MVGWAYVAEKFVYCHVEPALREVEIFLAVDDVDLVPKELSLSQVSTFP